MEEAGKDIFFSIVVLGYGSGKFLIPFIEKLHQLLSKRSFRWEIILVGNYSSPKPDETALTALDLQERFSNVISVVMPKQGMAGWDLRQGMDKARGKIVGFIDGDGQNPIESIFACLDKLISEDLDLVKTYRISRGDGYLRMLVSKVYNFLFKILFRINFKDINSNPKILLRDKYERLELKSDDWFFDAEIMLKASKLNYRVAEIPIHFRALDGRNSFVNLETIWEFLVNIWRYRFKRNNR